LLQGRAVHVRASSSARRTSYPSRRAGGGGIRPAINGVASVGNGGGRPTARCRVPCRPALRRARATNALMFAEIPERVRDRGQEAGRTRIHECPAKCVAVVRCPCAAPSGVKCCCHRGNMRCNGRFVFAQRTSYGRVPEGRYWEAPPGKARHAREAAP